MNPLAVIWAGINRAMELGKFGEDGHDDGDD